MACSRVNFTFTFTFTLHASSSQYAQQSAPGHCTVNTPETLWVVLGTLGWHRNASFAGLPTSFAKADYRCSAQRSVSWHNEYICAVETRNSWNTVFGEVSATVQLVPRSKHTAYLLRSQSGNAMWQLFVLRSAQSTVNTLCGQNAELLNVKLAVHALTTVRYI